jgi:hypothetical protein
MDKVKTLRKRPFHDAENSTLFKVNSLFDPNQSWMNHPVDRFWWSPGSSPPGW